jgi:hypothetical protein
VIHSRPSSVLTMQPLNRKHRKILTFILGEMVVTIIEGKLVYYSKIIIANALLERHRNQLLKNVVQLSIYIFCNLHADMKSISQHEVLVVMCYQSHQGRHLCGCNIDGNNLHRQDSEAFASNATVDHHICFQSYELHDWR